MPPLTRAESSRYQHTSTHAEVMAFIEALCGRGDARLQRTTLGASPGGRELPLLVLSGRGLFTPEASRRAGVPVVLLQAGIHAGEVEGKEAVLMLVRDLLVGDGDVLNHLTVVVLPLFNPDGNDAIDPSNRALHLPRLSGQLGPVSGVGTRVNAAKINLNRDYLRQDAVEMQLWSRGLWQRWAPDLTVDNHATNGSVHRQAMTFDIPHTVASGRPEPIDFMRHRLTPAVTAAVHRTTGFGSGWYGNFLEDERMMDADADVDPAARVGEGWVTYPHHPRFGSNYRGLCGRMDLLLEAYAYIPFAERVAVAYAWMAETLRFAAAHADPIRDTVAAAESPPAKVAIRYRLTAFDAPITVPTRTPRTMAGAPSTVTLPHVGRFVGTHTVARPCGYAVSPKLAQKLRDHGLVEAAAAGALDVQVPVVTGYGATAGRGILEAGQTADVSVAWTAKRRALPPGWALVPTEQRLGALAVYLCEPESDDGPIENGLIGPANVASELDVWRVD